MVHKTVERMGGQVGFESAPRKGTAFGIELKKAD
jgi:signal transduction histidine kinase